MIGNLGNTVLGIWVTAVAVLDPSLFARRAWLLALSGLIAVGAAALAGRQGAMRWSVRASQGAGLALLLLGAGRPFVPSGVFAFWIELWAGILLAVAALWAALYRPPPPRKAEHPQRA
ncbi:conserved membrane protein of unknown function [Methylacidimicrobium sp. AP8]|uniref:hypothetical protein n=1 Tax=Methylacidimicrobium sp. AP8 TaxID=2730359 RepID=UPI0018C10A54|nr:hypothetical protein [Methylacidimicrobium sp. AP8]CAB4244135.1 conserved membrane protein of unknown function [Methylacidimicrobium sp. AP8]